MSLLQQQIGRKDTSRKPNRVRTPKPDQHTQAKPKSREVSLWQSLQILKPSHRKIVPMMPRFRVFLGNYFLIIVRPLIGPLSPKPNGSHNLSRSHKLTFPHSSADQVLAAMIGQSSPAKPAKNVMQRMCCDLWDCHIFHASAIHNMSVLSLVLFLPKMTRKRVKLRVRFQPTNRMLPLLW